MISLRMFRRLAAFGILLALAACSSPNPVLYTIVSVPGQEYRTGPGVIVLQQIGLERYLERSQIVRSSENFKLDVMSNDWWGEPLGAMLTRVLVEELGQRLPQSVVLSEVGVVTAAPDVTIALNIQRLDEDAAGNVILQAQAGVTFKGRAAPTLRSFRYMVPRAGVGTAGEVAAISTAVGRLADALALLLSTSASPGKR